VIRTALKGALGSPRRNLAIPLSAPDLPARAGETLEPLTSTDTDDCPHGFLGRSPRDLPPRPRSSRRIGGIPRGAERGAALVLVIGAVAILLIISVEMASWASADSLRTARGRREGAFRRLLNSSGELGRGLLVEREPAAFHFWGEPWNVEHRITLGPGEVASLRLADESGKLNIARAWTAPGERDLVRIRLSRLFGYLRRHEPLRDGEWKEAEQGLLRRMEDPETLLSLDGLRETGLRAPTLFGPDGLHRFLTCHGDGRINLNTAPRAVLFALGEAFDEALVDRIAAYRGSGQGAPGAYRPFEDPRDLMLVDGIVTRLFVDGQPRVLRNLFDENAGVLGVSSTAFSIRVEAEVSDRRRQGWWFLRPDGGRLGFEEVLP
jgi:hypothetical protein